MNDPDEGLLRCRETHVSLIPAPPGWRAIYHKEDGYDKPPTRPLVGWLHIERTKTFVNHDSSRREEVDRYFVAAIMEEDFVIEANGVPGLRFKEVVGPPSGGFSVNQVPRQR